jgi:hypothetical protein
MGVMPCNREDCEHAMCDRYSDEYGYICSYCFEELVALGTWDIQHFMDTPKQVVHKPGESFYAEIFPNHGRFS